MWHVCLIFNVTGFYWEWGKIHGIGIDWCNNLLSSVRSAQWNSKFSLVSCIVIWRCCIFLFLKWDYLYSEKIKIWLIASTERYLYFPGAFLWHTTSYEGNTILGVFIHSWEWLTVFKSSQIINLRALLEK